MYSPEKTLIKGYHVYLYTFLDDLSFIKKPSDVFRDKPKEDLDSILHKIKEVFLRAGWEGDGEIGVIWLPPFVDTGYEDTWGNYILHVKQRNNGISFIASEHPLQFERLLAQNEPSPDRKGIPVNIINSAYEFARDRIKSYKSDLDEILLFIEKSKDNPVYDKTKEHLLTHLQGLLVRTLHEFLDECYLRFVVEVINDGNPSKIKLRKSKVFLRLDQTHTEDDDITEDGSQWLTIQGIISDIWKAYKFEPYKNKIEMLFKSIDYKWSPEKLFEFHKHVILRNCIHHHEEQLHQDFLKQLGKKNIKILNEGGHFEITAWNKVIFTPEEINHLIGLFTEFVEDFNSYIDKRIPTRWFLHKGSEYKSK